MKQYNFMATMALSALLLFLCCAQGCTINQPKDAQTNSSEFPTLDKKVRFLQRYVTFKRHYETLDFYVFYKDNSGGIVPGPSDWEICLVATVPEAEIKEWIDDMSRQDSGTQQGEGEHQQGGSEVQQQRAWLSLVPTQLDISGVQEWYGTGGIEVGIDRQRNIVVYYNKSYNY